MGADFYLCYFWCPSLSCQRICLETFFLPIFQIWTHELSTVGKINMYHMPSFWLWTFHNLFNLFLWLWLHLSSVFTAFQLSYWNVLTGLWSFKLKTVKRKRIFRHQSSKVPKMQLPTVNEESTKGIYTQIECKWTKSKTYKVPEMIPKWIKYERENL